MTLTAEALKTLLHRTVLALVLLAFMAPGPVRLPADDVRAAYAAAGLLCAPDEGGHSHQDAQCVLCMLSATGAAPETVFCAALVAAVQLSIAAGESDLTEAQRSSSRHARAPPSSIV